MVGCVISLTPKQRPFILLFYVKKTNIFFVIYEILSIMLVYLKMSILERIILLIYLKKQHFFWRFIICFKFCLKYLKMIFFLQFLAQVRISAFSKQIFYWIVLLNHKVRFFFQDNTIENSNHRVFICCDFLVILVLQHQKVRQGSSSSQVTEPFCPLSQS